jgi:hypothetical protein
LPPRFDRRLELAAGTAESSRPWPCFLFRLDRRLDDAEDGFSEGLAGAAGVSGLDIVARPFRLLRGAAEAVTEAGTGGGWACGGVLSTRCRLDLRDGAGDPASAGTGLVSAALRFRVLEPWVVVGGAAAGGSEAADGIDEAAWLAA